ncbi:lipopolysaccharide biosynthesis protein [Haloarcula onubensis]|uniref:Oligosaccharide flippase family protein n=1 Tax=Haloarcula onubensis TaxID=2950539 RepID=A0ABU2FVQ2_9EURY|nr:oligosaccharide flippase family protein [Halomicroarcula sp. S3CR25-11]MDS0284524.1 oligosaccharide flippase family protein [Halomicroarcula sp. S3CR25-11]
MARADTGQRRLAATDRAEMTIAEFGFGDLSETVRQFLQDVGLYTVAGLVPALFSVLALTIFTRLFRPAAFGRYSIAIAVGGIVSTLLFGWLNNAIIRFAPEVDTEQLVGTVFAVVAGLSTALVALAAVGYGLAGDSLGAYQPFYVAKLAFLVLQGTFQPMVAVFRATLNSKYVTLFMCVKSVVMLASALLVVLYVTDHITGWIWGHVIGMAVGILALLAASDILIARPRVDRSVLVRIAGYGLPMVGWILGDPLLNQADRFLIEFLRGSAMVGIYFSNYSLADRGLRLAMIPLLDAIQPIIINRWEGDNEAEIEALLTRFTKYFLLLAVPALVLLAALSRPLSTVFLGEAYHEGYVVIPIVATGVFVWSLSNLGQIGLEIRERTALMSRGLLCAVVFNVVVNVPLILTMGYLGAAIGTLLSYGVYALFVVRASRSRIEWRLPTATVVRGGIAGCGMATVPGLLYVSGWYSFERIFLAAGLSLVTYASGLYLTGELSRDTVVQLRNMT